MLKHLLTLLPTFLFLHQANAQQAELKAIEEEGKALYRLEMASWHGTDVFMERMKNRSPRAGGYFSYENKEGVVCIFFSKGDEPTVLASIQFDSTYDLTAVKLDSTERSFLDLERNIHGMRTKALAIINSDSLFKTYNNTNLNLIPLVWKGERKLYVLTGPTVHGVVVFGNDYLLTFDNANNLTAKRKLHQGIIPVNYKQGEEDIFGMMHTHLPETGEYITPTDVCTLMLYGKFTKWKQHLVIAEKYVSIWDCENNRLIALPKEAWESMGSDGKKKKRK